MDEIPASKLRRRRILTWVTMPIVFLSVQSAFRDLGRQGHADSVATAPMGGLLVAAVLVFCFFVAAWWFSDFRYRSIVLGLEVLMGVALLIAPREGWKTTISAWDIASDVALLVLACAQMRDSTNGHQQAAVRSDAVGS